jgi:L-fucose isomerase-like protein
MRVQPLIGLYGVLEKTEEGGEEAGSTLAEAARQLSAAGLAVVQARDLVVDEASADRAASQLREANPDLLLAVVITWSFDHLSWRIVKELDRPLAILAIPGIRAGSIVGAHQLGSLLTDLEIERAIFYGDPRAASTYAPVAAYARAAAVRRRLQRGKIAFVGRRTPGMTPIAFDEVEIMARFGTQVVSYGWEEILELVKAIAAPDVEAVTSRLRASAGSVTSDDRSLREVAALYLGLKGIAEDQGILAYGLGCYPHLAGTACLVTSLLSGDGIPAACEGDLNAGLAMFLVQALSGEPAHFGEILQLDEADNSLVTSHCGCAAFALAEKPADIALTPVRIWERGVCIRFPAKASPQATYLNLVGRKGNYRMCAVSGSAVKTQMLFEGNPVRFKPGCSLQRLLRAIDEHGFGHHWMMGYTDMTAEVKAFCRMTGIKGVFLGADEP